MRIENKDIIEKISKIRDEIGHASLQPDIVDIIFNNEKLELLIITADRSEKSLVIGKGGWVVGKLKEEMKINQIHVEAYPDIMLRKYRMELALKKLEEIIAGYDARNRKPLENLGKLIGNRIKNPFQLGSELEEFSIEKVKSTNKKFKAVVALSGGVDSAYALVIAELTGFNPLAVTVNPGEIILPRHFQDKVEKLTEQLSVEHQYLDADLSQVVDGALEGRYHPCGRCSKLIEDTVMEHAQKEKVPFVIFGDLLATGAQSLVRRGDVLRINLPAMLSANKGETKALAQEYGVSRTGGYGCPLLGEVKKKYDYMGRFSVQRILRETRAGILEPGEALDMIMSLCRK